MEYFCRKARYGTYGNIADSTSTVAYMCVVSRETVRTDLILATLNYFEFKTADTKIAYQIALAPERIQTVL